MPYHHGNLREALVLAGVELARSGGPDAVVLRAVSRDSGVSHNAAYRHFADREQLLGAVREECFRALAQRMRDRLGELDGAAEGDAATQAWNRLSAVGRAYVDFALSEPGWFRTAFHAPEPWDPTTATDGDPYDILQEVLDGLVVVGALAPERRPNAELVAWAAVHGLAALFGDGPLRDVPASERDAGIEHVLASVAAGL